MIELRGLHLGNIARSPAESVRPDLWPDHAWVPALGRTGVRVFDLCCHQNHLSATGSLGWSYGGGIGYGVYTSPDDGTYKYPLPTGVVRSWSLPWTAVVVAAPWSSSMDCRAFGCWTSTAQTGGWAIWYDAGGSAPSWSMAFARQPSGTTYYRIIGNNTPSGGQYKTSVAIGGWKGGQSPDQWFFRVDGKEITESFTSVSDPIYPGDTTAQVYSLGERSDSPFFGLTSANMLYWRALAVGQSLDLAADPLLPFRRRTQVYYSVPSGGDPEPPVSNETPAAMMMGI